MAQIKKIYDDYLLTQDSSTEIYPITSTLAVYDADSVVLDTILEEIKEDISDLELLWEAGEGESSVKSISASEASGDYSIAEGNSTVASGTASHAEGEDTSASGAYSHSEGISTSATGYFSHVEGSGSIASNSAAHAEGYDTVASGVASHAEGEGTTSSGEHSHAEGQDSVASGAWSHAEGQGTISQNQSEHSQGQFNVSNTESSDFGDAGNTIHSIGIGTENSAKNAFEIMQNGDMYIYGLGDYEGTSIENSDSLQDIVSNVLDTATTTEIQSLFS